MSALQTRPLLVLSVVLATLALTGAGCAGGSILNPFDRSQVPTVTVNASGSTPVISWTPQDAQWVTVDDASGETVWRVTMSELPVRSPLRYGAPSVSTTGGSGRETWTHIGPEALVAGQSYTVTVHRQDEKAAASGGGFTGLRANTYEGTASFVAR